VWLEKARLIREFSSVDLFIDLSPPTLIGPMSLRCSWPGRFHRSYTGVGDSASTALLRRWPPGVSSVLLSERGLIDADCSIVGDRLDGRVDPTRRNFSTRVEPGVAVVVEESSDSVAELDDGRALAFGAEPFEMPHRHPGALAEWSEPADCPHMATPRVASRLVSFPRGKISYT
jgi:hypothetical protein